MLHLLGLALIDCSATSQTIALLSEAVNLDNCVVLANKKPLTSSLVTESFLFLPLNIFVALNIYTYMFGYVL